MMSLTQILPEISLIVGVMLITLVGVFGQRVLSHKISYIFGLGVLIIAFYLNSNLFAGLSDGKYTKLTNVSYLVLSFRSVILIFGFLALLMIKGLSEKYQNLQKFEVNILVVIAILGALVMVSANDLLTLYIGAELQSLSLYCLTALNKNSEKASEAAMKYFILGAIASGVMLFGMSLIYGYSGTIEFSTISEMYSGDISGLVIPPAFMVGLVLVLSAFLFKVAAVPFHVWSPDVYEGATLPITGFFASVPKAAGVFVIVKFIILDFSVWFDELSQIIVIVTIASMFLGSLAAIKQTEFKRLIAYSSIANVGFILTGLLGNNSGSISATFIYVIIYGISILGAFAVVSMLNAERAGDHYALNIFKGLGKSHPVIALSLAAILLSMAGIPPLAGFFAKFVIIKELVNSEFFVMSGLLVIASVISAYYYLKIIKLMYFDDSDSIIQVNYYPCSAAIATIAVVLIIALVFLPSSITNFAEVNASYFQ